MDPQKITELANLLRKNGDKILSSEFTLTLSGSLLRALNDSFTLIADSVDIGGTQTFQVVKPINAKSHVFRDLQLLHDFVQKTALLRLVYYPSEPYFEGAIDIAKFRALRRLELQKINVQQVVGIQPLRAQLQHLICVRSLRSVEDIITRCGGDNSNGFVWNELRIADFSYNNLQTVDTSLEFAQYLQHLSLRHNKLHSVAAIRWLPHLKTLDLSYNCLVMIPQFHGEACKRLQRLNISNNYVEELLDVAKLEALSELDLSDNCLLEHSQLLPLSALLTLCLLKLHGNPLHCNPKHRLATCQYLHQNSSTVKFMLDGEPLSKAEKDLTGSQKLRYMGALKRSVRSQPTSISNSRSSTANTPASSYDSRRSVLLQDSSSEAEQANVSASETQSVKRRGQKMRTVDIEEQLEGGEAAPLVAEEPTESVTLETNDSAHLQTKKQIEELRQKFGTEWLQSGNAELMQSMLGIEAPQTSEQEMTNSRQLFQDYLGEFASDAEQPAELQQQPLNISSTPTNESHLTAAFEATLTPIKAPTVDGNTTDSSQAAEDTTIYHSFDVSLAGITAQEEQLESEPEPDIYADIYKSSKNPFDEEEEPEVSDTEPDEQTYTVYNAHKPSEPLFLTISSNFLREKDTLTERTKTKWSLKILESCERVKSNTLRINFDTVKKDKQERIYSLENPLCQELEKKLRDILSQRDLTEMNISIYRCVNCGSQFMHEVKPTHYRSELRCPNCSSKFIAEVHEEEPSLEKDKEKGQPIPASPKLSPALIVEESPVSTPMVLESRVEDDNSIGSANSLNESSSCSKITNSQCSFDSNQSVVGSSNTERDLEFRANESDVDIISNPSQSSIEVLDVSCAQTGSRKTSEERRISQIPNLETIDDDMSYTQSFIEREFGQLRAQRAAAATTESKDKSSLAQVQLTESSSSGSVTDSICTKYEVKDKVKEKQPASDNAIVLHNMLLAESSSDNNNELKEANKQAKKEDAGLSSMFEAVFQSTNKLMSSSKKLIEAEAAPPILASSAYKFNYSDYNDIDHRLKLYFYQRKFEEAGEHFKWLARGRIYNEQTRSLCDGLVVMSTCKCYLMEAYAPPQDDVSKWLRQLVSVTMDRLARIQLLPWKLGLSFTLRDWGGFLLLLQDILRTDSLLLHFANASLPDQCELEYKPAASISQRLSTAVGSQQLKICALLSGCEWSGNAPEEKRCFELCALLTTDTQLYVSATNRLDWLCSGAEQPGLELTLTQQMSNLVEVERLTDCECNINFLDETQNSSELWHLKFETKECAECCLNAIGQSWEQIFGVPLA